MPDWRAVRAAVLGDLRPTGPSSFESRAGGGGLGRAKLIFPASSWQNAREAGVPFRSALERLSGRSWLVLDALIDQLGLSVVYFTSLYRATGTGPHREGRALDLGYVQRVNDPSLTLLARDDAGKPEAEPALARSLRELLIASPHVTQVLTPWWIYSKGTRNDPNDNVRELDVGHRDHLHITLAQGEPSVAVASRRRPKLTGTKVAIAAALLGGLAWHRYG